MKDLANQIFQMKDFTISESRTGQLTNPSNEGFDGSNLSNEGFEEHKYKQIYLQI